MLKKREIYIIHNILHDVTYAHVTPMRDWMLCFPMDFLFIITNGLYRA